MEWEERVERRCCKGREVLEAFRSFVGGLGAAAGQADKKVGIALDVLSGLLETTYNTATLMEFVQVYANEFESGVRSGRISGNSIREAKQHARRALVGEYRAGTDQHRKTCARALE